MEWFLVTLNIYRRVLTRAASLAVKNWPVLGSLFVYSVVLTLAAQIAALAGLAGGFAFSLVWAACAGSFLYLVEMIVRTSKVTLTDFRDSFTAYLWDVVGIAFVAWVFFTLATPAIAQLPQSRLVFLCLYIGIFILFNAVPELIYLGHHSALALLSESYVFIAANWIEWLPVMGATAVAYNLWEMPFDGPLGYFAEAAAGLIIYFVMVLRGLLFLELHNSTQRGRAFKYRSRQD